mmetsp:Transcript_35262/g.83643  ORF Transcript_35262/g.83643 Transcript_35262/m.83643 type:complete len:223 (-) Transcript_35262:984-1652(-)
MCAQWLNALAASSSLTRSRSDSTSPPPLVLPASMPSSCICCLSRPSSSASGGSSSSPRDCRSLARSRSAFSLRSSRSSSLLIPGKTPIAWAELLSAAIRSISRSRMAMTWALRRWTSSLSLAGSSLLDLSFTTCSRSAASSSSISATAFVSGTDSSSDFTTFSASSSSRRFLSISISSRVARSTINPLRAASFATRVICCMSSSSRTFSLSWFSSSRSWSTS